MLDQRTIKTEDHQMGKSSNPQYLKLREQLAERYGIPEHILMQFDNEVYSYYNIVKL